MANPVVAGASLGLNAAGGVISALGAKESADAQAAAYRYKAGVAMLNKQINEQNAAWSVQAGGLQGIQYGRKVAQEIANTKVAQSGTNLDINSGSPARVRQTQTDVAQFDENVIQWNTSKTAYGYETKANTDLAEAELDKQAASQQEIAGDIAMTTSFINAGSNVASKWMQGKTAGMWG